MSEICPIVIEKTITSQPTGTKSELHKFSFAFDPKANIDSSLENS